MSKMSNKSFYVSEVDETGSDSSDDERPLSRYKASEGHPNTNSMVHTKRRRLDSSGKLYRLHYCS